MTNYLKFNRLILCFFVLGAVVCVRHVHAQDNNQEIEIQIAQEISDAEQIVVDSEKAARDLFVLAKRIHAAGKYSEASVFLKRVTESEFAPDDVLPHALVHLGDCTLALDRLQDATAIYEQIAADYPTNYEAGEYYPNLSRFVQLRLGRCYSDPVYERYEDALAAYKLFFSLPGPAESAPVVEMVWYLLARTHYLQAHTLRLADFNSTEAVTSYNSAIDAFKAVLENTSETAESEFVGLVNFYLARSFQFSDNETVADQGIRRIAGLTPGNRFSAAATMEAGSYYQDRTRHEDAVSLLQKVVSFSTGDGTFTPSDRLAAVARERIAQSYVSRGDFANAIAQQQLTVDGSAFDDRKAFAQFAIGLYLLESEDYERAVTAFEKLATIDPGIYIPSELRQQLLLKSEEKLAERKREREEQEQQ